MRGYGNDKNPGKNSVLRHVIAEQVFAYVIENALRCESAIGMSGANVNFRVFRATP
jgi:hypothetical protein